MLFSLIKKIVYVLLFLFVFHLIPLYWEPVFPPVIRTMFTLGDSISFIYGWWGFILILLIGFFRKIKGQTKLADLDCVYPALFLSPVLLYLWIPVYVSPDYPLRRIYYKNFFHSPIWQTTLFLLVLLGILGMYRYFTDHNHRTSKQKTFSITFWNNLFIAILTAYILSTLTIALLEYSILENWEDMDTNIQSYAQTLKGNFFNSYLERSSFKGMNVMLGTHTRPILLLILPFYALFPTGETLLVFKTIIMSLSAIPLYLLFKKLLDPAFGLVLTLSYLLFPPFMSQHFHGFHEVCLAPLFIGFTIYFFERDRLGWFLVMYFFALMVKEHVGIILLPYILLAFLKKRNWQWMVYPAVLSAVWVGVTFFYIIPRFRPDDCLIYAHYSVKSHGESGLKGLISTLFLNPGAAFQTLKDRFYFIYVYFSQGGFAIPFLTPASMFLILPLVKNVFFFPYDPPVTFHHSMISVPFLFYCIGLAVARIMTAVNKNKQISYQTWRFVVFFFILATTFINSPIWLQTINLKPVPELETMKESMALIPDDVKVAAPQNMTQKLAPRCEVVYLDYLTIIGDDAADYIIINTNRDFRPIRNLPKKDFLKTGYIKGYKQIWEKHGIYILKRGEPRVKSVSRDK